MNTTAGLPVLVLASWLAMMPVEAQDSTPDEIQRFRVDVNLVTLRFTAHDQSGRFVNDLEADDFGILENGVARPLTFFEAPRAEGGTPAALWLAFLIDVSGSTFSTRAEEILAARSFFENIHDFTQVGIFGFTDHVIPFQEFSPNKEAALAAFNSARPHKGQTALYASVDALMERISRLAGPRDQKVIIVVSDGMDDAYSRSPASAELARAQGVRLYTIWVPSAAQLHIRPTAVADNGEVTAEVRQLKADRRAKEEAYARLSGSSGGRHFGGFEAILDFDEVLAEINDEIFGNLYSMAYHTPDPLLDRPDRNVEVRVLRPGLNIQGLFHKVPERMQSKKSYIAALFDNEALASLTQSTGSFREIGAQVDLLGSRPAGELVRLPFRVKISPFGLKADPENGGIRTQLGIIGLLVDAQGRDVVRLREVFRARLETADSSKSIIYNNALLAPPGRYSFRLAILEIASWRMTVFEFEVNLSP